MDYDATWYGGRPRSRRLCVRWAPSFPSPKGAQLPNFRPNSAVAKRPDRLRLGATWYGLPRGPGDCVRWGPSYPRKKAHPPHPIFGPCLLWPNGWMDEDATWYGSRPRPRPHCIRRGPSSPRKGHSSPIPLFSAHAYCGQTVAHLIYCWALVIYFRCGSSMKWNKSILKNFRMFQCFILTWNHVWNEIKLFQLLK